MTNTHTDSSPETILKEWEKDMDYKFPRLVISINESQIGFRDERIETDGSLMKGYIRYLLTSYIKACVERIDERIKLLTHGYGITQKEWGDIYADTQHEQVLELRKQVASLNKDLEILKSPTPKE